MNNLTFTKSPTPISISTNPVYIPQPQAQQPQLYPNASKILDNLWLGDRISSEDENFIRNNNIRVIINCTKELPNIFKPFYVNTNDLNKPHLKDAFLEYSRVEIENNDKMANQEQFFNQLPNLVQHIDQKLNVEKKAVLIHCCDGKQRSATAVAAYIYFKYHQTNGCKMEEVIDHMKKQRPAVFSYGYVFNFKKTLDQFVVTYNTQLQQFRSQQNQNQNQFQLPQIGQLKL